ncbi:unnamed protein product [Ilex paraguariensis]|uniref:Uncharacterized protein n=1 Tax=Ilex paraguariensis TaxID=185542 RepID=A0ABC8U972_9AQUA
MGTFSLRSVAMLAVRCWFILGMFIPWADLDASGLARVICMVATEYVDRSQWSPTEYVGDLYLMLAIKKRKGGDYDDDIVSSLWQFHLAFVVSYISRS